MLRGGPREEAAEGNSGVVEVVGFWDFAAGWVQKVSAFRGPCSNLRVVYGCLIV